MIAMLMDTLSKGNGFVQSEIENDQTLRQSLELEGAVFVNFLTNRWKILTLTAVDTFNGKKLQRLSEPAQQATVEVLINEDGEDCQGADMAHNISTTEEKEEN
jgi:hypothetical protein